MQRSVGLGLFFLTALLFALLLLRSSSRGSRLQPFRDELHNPDELAFIPDEVEDFEDVKKQIQISKIEVDNEEKEVFTEEEDEQSENPPVQEDNILYNNASTDQDLSDESEGVNLEDSDDQNDNQVLPDSATFAPTSEIEMKEKTFFAALVRQHNTSQIKYCFQHTKRKSHPGEGGTPIQYIHIPKAGGTSVQLSFLEWIKNVHSIPIYKHNGGHGANWTCPGTLDRGFLFGHRGFGFCHRLLQRYRDRVFYIVSIRDPISHFRSFFDFTMHELTQDHPEDVKLWRGKKLNELVLEYNHTLSLGLDPSDERMKGPLKFLAMSKQQTAFMCGWDCVAFDKFGVTDEQMINRAMKNLYRADVVVIMEKLDDMLHQLRYHIPWIPQGQHHLKRENIMVRTEKSHLSARAIEIISHWTHLDERLYRAAKQRHYELTAIAKRCYTRFGPKLPK